MRHRQALFPLGVLTLLAALTFWLNHAIQRDAPPPSGRDRHDPDFIVENFTLKHFDESGNLKHTMHAAKMVHYPDDDTTEVSRPNMSFTGRAEPTHVHANHARLSADGEEVVLIGDVVVVREAGKQRSPLNLMTSLLKVYPDEEIARTDAPVTVKQGNSVISGVGMDANNVTGVATLRSRVTGTISNKGRS